MPYNITTWPSKPNRISSRLAPLLRDSDELENRQSLNRSLGIENYLPDTLIASCTLRRAAFKSTSPDSLQLTRVSFYKIRFFLQNLFHFSFAFHSSIYGTIRNTAFWHQLRRFGQPSHVDVKTPDFVKCPRASALTDITSGRRTILALYLNNLLGRIRFNYRNSG